MTHDVVALTGASGFLGSRVHRLLVASGVDVRRIGRRDAEATVDLVRASPRWGDLALAPDLAEPSALVHCAGIMAVDAASVLDSAKMAVHLLTDLPASVRRLVLVSSAYVYAPSVTNVTEDEPARPGDVYGHAKSMVESLFQGVARATGRELVVLRPCAIYGPDDPNQKVITRFVADAKRNVPPTLAGRVSFQRDYVHVDDAAACVAAALRAKIGDEPRIFNVCTGKAWSAVEVARLLGELVPSLRVETEAASAEPIGYRFDPTRAAAELGFVAKLDLRSALSSLLGRSEDRAPSANVGETNP